MREPSAETEALHTSAERPAMAPTVGRTSMQGKGSKAPLTAVVSSCPLMPMRAATAVSISG
jgi:hypothetical protein